MSKCADCKRPRAEWTKRLKAYVFELRATPYDQEGDYNCGKADARLDISADLLKMLKELE